jgi:hypothetical protein
MLAFSFLSFSYFSFGFVLVWFFVCVSSYVRAYLATLYPYGDNNDIQVCLSMITSSILKLIS